MFRTFIFLNFLIALWYPTGASGGDIRAIGWLAPSQINSSMTMRKPRYRKSWDLSCGLLEFFHA
ncbi:hypothetical protein AB7M56_006097 [Bradyrhizobium elkanii]|jgi:hypothetical protein|nr:hypothetical protein [Bradyrhizobium elkanii]MCS4066927.1 hypothetical protein [Bradyrhizobium elkanii]MCS4082462.1 hypothetical protein [Bradyrhizobium elkanii]MCW2127920.1 hypothetical protein [Bradyrhizobium elkanii]MCW2174663.1 hypothetical protein [Bradyrhizobium elkanii]